jgi:60 kDa SS-A/Ro ribonucleoprotein
MRRHRQGSTDCALPMLWALEQGIEADVFAIYTDNETWVGHIHPIQALARYRERTGIPAKLAVIGMQADQFSIADPNDAGMMDFVGLDPATPGVLQNFASGPKP